jgi:aryl-alcohol dehydrogenase-like predicted oxidoreductase
MRADGAIILDILNLIGRFFKFGMEAIQPVSAVQTEYSLMNRAVEQNGVLKTCGELGIGFVPWGPVGQGYLSVKIDARTKQSQFYSILIFH